MKLGKKQNNITTNDKKLIWSKIFGDKAFIILMFSLFLPSALQQLVTTAVTYVDTFFIAGFSPSIMMGNDISSLGHGLIAKTSIGIATSIINFPLMVVLGIGTGVGIVTAQYYGANDVNKVRQTIVYKIIFCLIGVTPFILLMMIIPEQLVSITRNVFSPKENTQSYYITKAASTYLFWSGPSFLLILLASSFGYSYREIGKPKYALIASIFSILSNVIMDPLLIIFETDLNNAMRNIALSTIASRAIEFGIMMIFIYAKKEQFLMLNHIKFEWNLFVVTIKNSWQSMLNDILYGFATLFLVICLLVYSEKYHDAFSTVSIIIQFTTVIFPGMAASCAVLVGNELGKDNIKQAKENSVYLIVWGSIITLFFALILFGLSFFINPLLSSAPPFNYVEYNEWLTNQKLAQKSEWIMMPVIFSQGMFSILYYSIKAGGSKFIFFTDGFVMSIWCIIFGSLVYTGQLSEEKGIKPELMFFLIEFNQIAKAILSFFFYKFSNWAINLTNNENCEYKI